MNLFGVFLLALFASGGIVIVQKKGLSMKLILMKFFRNLVRHKARKRLYGKSGSALIPLLLGKEKPLIIRKDGENTETITIEELAQMNGQTEDTPLYISIRNRVYDVSAARKMYGPGKSYHVFVGRDATRAFATGCTKEECMLSSIDGLTSEQLHEIDRWIELYETHDKYKYIGKLISDPVNSLVDKEVEENNSQ
eukprot:gene8194-11084_t